MEHWILAHRDTTQWSTGFLHKEIRQNGELDPAERYYTMEH